MDYPADRAADHPTDGPPDDHTARIAISWALVSIPLAYGLYNAIEAAAKLFTG